MKRVNREFTYTDLLCASKVYGAWLLTVKGTQCSAYNFAKWLAEKIREEKV